MSFPKNQIDDLIDLVYPPVCGICGMMADSPDRLICQECWNSIRGLDAPYCLECHQFQTTSVNCADCDQPTMIIFSLGHFDRSLKKIIHDLKFSGLKPLARPLAQKLAAGIEESRVKKLIDLIIPVPLHASRYNIRGFNQAEEIGREISRLLDIPMNTDLLYAARKTKQQAKLHGTQREANVRGAFAVSDRKGIIAGKSVLLIDDVTTTGATLRENERVIMTAGADRVFSAVAATSV